MSRVPAEQRREQLIEATIDLAIREGLAAASVRRIADEANVSLGVVHYCFSSKEALLNAVAESFITPILGPVAKAIEQAEVAGLEATAHAAFMAFWDVTHATPGRQLLSYELTAWSLRGDGEAARLLYKTYTDVIEEFITLGLGITGNEFLSARTVARMVLTVTDGVMMAWMVDRDDDQAMKVLTAFVAVLLSVVRQMREFDAQQAAQQDAEPAAEVEPASQDEKADGV